MATEPTANDHEGVAFQSLNNDVDDILIVLDNAEYPPVARTVVNSGVRAVFTLSEGDELQSFIGTYDTGDFPEKDGIVVYANFDAGAPYCTECKEFLASWDTTGDHLYTYHDEMEAVDAVASDVFIPVLRNVGEYDDE